MQTVFEKVKAKRKKKKESENHSEHTTLQHGEDGNVEFVRDQHERFRRKRTDQSGDDCEELEDCHFSGTSERRNINGKWFQKNGAKSAEETGG